MHKRAVMVLCRCLAALALLLSRREAFSAVSLTVDGGKTYQTIEGFGVNANYYAWNDNNDLEPVLDALIDQAGMTLFRVVFNNGWETNNDNGDSNLMNWNYYNTVYGAPNAQKLWGILGYLNQRGITNGITLNFQGAGPAWMMNSSHLATGYEDEWAEMITSLLLYARYTNQLQFNMVAPNNEPDITGEGINIPTVSQYLTTLHDLALKMNTNGLSDMKMVVPDRSTASTNWLPEIMTDPVIMARLGHFGLHSYSSGGTGSQGVSNLLARSSYPDRTFWMTEFNVWCDVCENGGNGTNTWSYWRGTVDYLLGHLANGASAGEVWEGYDSYYPHHGRWSFWGLLAVANTNASPKIYTPRKGFYGLAQVAKFVRPGAQRIDARGTIDPLVALAFYQTNSGQVTIVGENTGLSATVLNGKLTNLPPVTILEMYYTDSTTNLYHSATVQVTNKAFTVSVPPDSVFTLVGVDMAHASVSVSITNPVDGAQYAAPATIAIAASATTSTGAVSRVDFYSNGVHIGQDTNMPIGTMIWSNVPPGDYSLTATATNTLGYWDVSEVVQVTVTGPPAQIVVDPTNAMVVPYGTQQFTASVLDALGTELDPAPAVSWSVNGGGAIDGNGFFSANGIVGGPFGVSATIDSIAGIASVSISTNVNLAPAGTGYFWYSLVSSNANSPLNADSDVNDGDLGTDVILGPDGKEDNSNAYEAAGVVWGTPQNVNRVVYVNGSYNSQHDGVFASEFGLQFSFDGTTWTNATGWTQSPAYVYNSAASAHVAFTFVGGPVAVLGARGVGRVHTSTSSTNSWLAFATELQAFAAPGTPPPRLSAAMATNLIAISWSSALTNYTLESFSNNPPVGSWSAVTNVPVVVVNQLRVWVPAAGSMRLFRLHQQ